MNNFLTYNHNVLFNFSVLHVNMLITTVSVQFTTLEELKPNSNLKSFLSLQEDIKLNLKMRAKRDRGLLENQHKLLA